MCPLLEGSPLQPQALQPLVAPLRLGRRQGFQAWRLSLLQAKQRLSRLRDTLRMKGIELMQRSFPRMLLQAILRTQMFDIATPPASPRFLFTSTALAFRQQYSPQVLDGLPRSLLVHAICDSSKGRTKRLCSNSAVIAMLDSTQSALLLRRRLRGYPLFAALSQCPKSRTSCSIDQSGTNNIASPFKERP